MDSKPPLKKRGQASQAPTDNRSLWRSVGLYGALGGQIVAVFLVCVWGGTWLDKKLDTNAVFLLLGTLLGMLVSGYQVYRLIQFEKKHRKS